MCKFLFIIELAMVMFPFSADIGNGVKVRGAVLVTGVRVAMFTLRLPIGSQRRNCFSLMYTAKAYQTAYWFDFSL